MRALSMAASVSLPAATIRSQPSTRSAWPLATRALWIASGRAASRTCDITAPPFCASPAMSRITTPLLSMCAAMPISAPIVTTPVPPTPVISTLYGSLNAGSTGRRQVDGRARLVLGRLAQLPAFDRDEARAEALHAGVVLVAGALVDRALAAQLRLQRHDRHAVGLHAAVAAAFANFLVDDDALGRIDHLLLLAPAPLLRRAGLRVDDDRHALLVAQLALHLVHAVTMADHRAFRNAAHRLPAFGIVGHQVDVLDSLGGNLLQDVDRAELAFDRLTARHRRRRRWPGSCR